MAPHKLEDLFPKPLKKLYINCVSLYLSFYGQRHLNVCELSPPLCVEEEEEEEEGGVEDKNST